MAPGADVAAICDQMRELTAADVVDSKQRREVYTAATALAARLEQRFDTLDRLCLSVSRQDRMD